MVIWAFVNCTAGSWFVIELNHSGRQRMLNNVRGWNISNWQGKGGGGRGVAWRSSNPLMFTE